MSRARAELQSQPDGDGQQAHVASFLAHQPGQPHQRHESHGALQRVHAIHSPSPRIGSVIGVEYRLARFGASGLAQGVGRKWSRVCLVVAPGGARGQQPQHGHGRQQGAAEDHESVVKASGVAHGAKEDGARRRCRQGR